MVNSGVARHAVNTLILVVRSALQTKNDRLGAIIFAGVSIVLASMLYFGLGAVSPGRGMFGFLLAECVGGGLSSDGGR